MSSSVTPGGTPAAHEPEQAPQTATASPTDPHRDRHPMYGSPLMDIRIASIPLPYFLGLFAVCVIAAFTGTLPSSMVAGMAVTILTGGILMAIGERIPVLRDYGLGVLLCTFGPALLIFTGLMPEIVTESVGVFLKDFGFLDFFVVAVITGSILGMPRELLIKAGPRFLVVVVGTILATLAIMGAIAMLLGFGFWQGVLLIAAPIMAGGLGVGAVPMAEMYASRTGTSPDAYMGDLLAVVAIANMLCIVFAAALSAQDKRTRQLFPGFNGHGQLLRTRRGAEEDPADAALVVPEKSESAGFTALGQGIVIAGAMFIVGVMLETWMPFLHSYAWTILAVSVLKIFRLLPEELEQSGAEWGDMLTTVFLPALLVSVSIAYIDFQEVVAALTDVRFIALIVLTVAVAGLTAGTIGYLFRSHFVEAAIVPGFIMADSGGSGDVAVLGAAKRIHLIAFAGLTTRLGGAVTLTLTSFLVPFLPAAG